MKNDKKKSSEYVSYFCPWGEKCIGGGTFFTCACAVPDSNHPNRPVFESRPACFKEADQKLSKK